MPIFPKGQSQTFIAVNIGAFLSYKYTLPYRGWNET